MTIKHVCWVGQVSWTKAINSPEEAVLPEKAEEADLSNRTGKAGQAEQAVEVGPK